MTSVLIFYFFFRFSQNRDLEDTLESLWLHIKSVMETRLKELNQTVDEATNETLKSQVLQIAKTDSPVRSLLWKRFVTYISLNLRNNSQIPTPPGYLDYVVELESFAAAFKRLTYYNHAVYREYYQELLDKINKQLNRTVE